MRRLGPEFKKPDLKVPALLADLYRDLRDHRLLPLVALILAALVAVPFLLSASASPPPAPIASSAEPLPGAPAGGAETRLTVVKATPGLREPGKRLSRLRAKDPFRQHYTNPPRTQEAAPSGTTSATTEAPLVSTTPTEPESTSAPSATTTPPPNESGGSSPGKSGSAGGNQGSTGQEGLVFYTFAIDVKITRTETKKDGGKDTSEPQIRHRVLPATPLPGEKAQVVTYMGISPTTRKPLLLVSTDVTAVFGEGKCVAGSDSCQLLEVEPEFPETFVYGPNDVRYKINVLKVEPVVTGHS
jgi:hypothetical protein